MAQAHSVTPLRQRMLDDMKLRNLALSTRKIYVSSVAGFSAYHGRSPDELTLEDVRDYQLHLVARGLKASSICPIMSALRFFYCTTLGNRAAAAEIPLPRKADPLPAILSQDEVKRLLTAVPDLKMRTLLTTVYAAGLRVSEAVGLQAGDIDSARMTIHIREGKGGRPPPRPGTKRERLTEVRDPLGGSARVAHRHRDVLSMPAPDRTHGRLSHLGTLAGPLARHGLAHRPALRPVRSRN